jgi:uncharacterized protein YidB (DUF937 family)
VGLTETIMGVAGKEIEGLVGGSGGNQLLGEVSSLLGQGGANLPALLEKFHANGLGGAAQSWVGTGPNQAITGDQAQTVLGADAVTKIAEKLGLPPDKAAAAVAAVLPHIVNHLTPNGAVPGGGTAAQAAGGLLKKLGI